MNAVFVPRITITLVAEECYLCGTPFAMPSTLRKERLADHRAFYCPNGHGQVYTGETEAQKLAKQLKAKQDELGREKHWREQSEEHARDLAKRVVHERARVNGYKGAIARTKNRVAKGQCPCCSHKFKDLKTHMVTEHPNWNPDKHADAMAAKES